MSSINGCKVFSATMFAQRQVLGDQVTEWLTEARKRPGFKLLDVSVNQSSDKAFHCLSIVLLFQDGTDADAAPKAKTRKGTSA